MDKSSMHFKSVCFSYIFLLFNPFTELLSKTGCLFLSVCSSVYPILHGCVYRSSFALLSAAAPRAGKQSGECFSAFAILVLARKK